MAGGMVRLTPCLQKLRIELLPIGLASPLYGLFSMCQTTSFHSPVLAGWWR